MGFPKIFLCPTIAIVSGYIERKREIIQIYQEECRQKKEETKFVCTTRFKRKILLGMGGPKGHPMHHHSE
jgi:hypothetical protein